MKFPLDIQYVRNLICSKEYIGASLIFHQNNSFDQQV
ncbi:hypothetical protein THICB1_20161 [Thiomonas arsenitoxydans]|uniref:Uncharacterized protein n=1 Tax=Thiomonas arsenitoxydans (strain DSM 22701 / CIP 110005 / 3As) TaxID=426114 RepID=A0ABP1Z502_THIA3|nr:hypothetical protein THICB6_120025 [Thiomonas arsenitoxydans]CQR32413.1 hypothetical protein THICB1_20161 [Thiomonas arsenitoxydans]CQR34392.1 hypothetical protein ACO7_400017 [Thiomonas arsenitoxydans]CQR34475.1 hypothetical protein ACO3_410016 [Thiomonas arsenitoxydans]